MNKDIFIVMKGGFHHDTAATLIAEPVESHYIESVAKSRAKFLQSNQSQQRFNYWVKPCTLIGSKTVAEFPGVNSRIQVEEPGKTPRRTRRLPREQAESGRCYEGERCVCGGDTPRVREGCVNWIKESHE